MLSTTVVERRKETPKGGDTLLKRTELPVYSEMPSSIQKSDEEIGNAFVFQAVQLFRKEGCKFMKSAQSISDRCSLFFNTGVAHAHSNYVTTVDYLHEERNILPRFGAISGGLLFGYIVALRKGFFKRLLYTTAGGIVAGSVCYPKEAEDYFKQSSQLSKKYLVFSYHFLNGVSKDLTGYELPSFPLKMLTQDGQEPVKKDEN